jgi:hypothetical protein
LDDPGIRIERRGRLRLEATGLGETHDAVLQRIGEQATIVFELVEARMTEDPTDPILELSIARREDDASVWWINGHVTHEGEVMLGSRWEGQCRQCTDDELVDAVAAAIELIVGSGHMDVEVPEDEPLPVTQDESAAEQGSE